MNGARGRSNNYLLDGTDMNDGYRNDPAINEAGVFGTPSTILPIDAVAEVRVLSNYEPEYGRNSGAIINIVTKSGANNFHGQRWSISAAARWMPEIISTSLTDPKSPFNNNQFGGPSAAPIVKDKTFFYADYEGQRENGAQAGKTCVPDPAVIPRPRRSPSWRHAPIRSLPPCSPAILGHAEYRRRACQMDRAIQVAPWQTISRPQPPSSIGVDSFIGKIDQNFNPNNMLTGRYYFGDSNQSFPFAQLAGGFLPGFNTVTPTRVQLIALSYVKVVNSNQVNEARLGWNRFAEGFFPQDQSFNPNSIGLDTGVSAYDGGLPATTRGRLLADWRDQFRSRAIAWIPTGTSSTTIRGNPESTT